MIAQLKPLAPVRHPDDDWSIFYPETDGMPLPDGEYQAPRYREVVSTLEIHRKQQPHTAVNGNAFIYYEMNNPRRSVSPDCYVAFGVDVDAIMEQNSYIVRRVGKPEERARADSAESCADSAELRADSAEARIREPEARLRRHGIDPAV